MGQPNSLGTMLLSRSSGRKRLVTGAAAVTFACLFEVTVFDSRHAAQQAELRDDAVRPVPGQRLRFTATAYCKGTTTASGVNVRRGIAAADPDLLPVGSVIQVDRLGENYDGIYTIMDTGPKVQGRQIDIYMWSCHEALKLGRRRARVEVLRLGWNPRNSEPSLVDRLFERREEVEKRERAVRAATLAAQPPEPALPASNSPQK